ncbi:MAG: thiamine pyrophosphate-binding protein [Methanobacteriota archaeon]
MRCQDAVVDALSKEKVRYVFGMSSGHSTAVLYDALHEHPEITPVLVRHEEAASFMASVWYQMTGEPGICSGTAGPGVAHLVPGIWEAYLGCHSIIAVNPAVADKFYGWGMLQEIPQRETFLPVTKWSWKLHQPGKVQWMMRRAFQIASNPPPGPVFLEIPIDVGDSAVELPEYTPCVRPIRIRADLERVKEAADLILKSERPILAVGGGVLRSGAFAELRDFAEMLSIPVCRTETGMGAMPDDHPLVVGGLGFWRTKPAKQVYEEADLIIAVGWHMEEIGTLGWIPLPPRAKLIQVDVDPNMIAKNYVPDIPLVGDAKLVLADLIEVLKTKLQKPGVLRRTERAAMIAKAAKDYEDEILSELTSEAVPIHPARFYHDVQKAVPRDATYVFDVGAHIIWDGSYPYFKMYTPYHASPSDHACVGFGVGGALAAKLARPDKPCACICGDAGVYMMGQELATQREYNAPVSTIFMNNSSIGEIKYWQRELYGRSIATDFTNPYDFVKFAEAQKAEGFHVEKPADIIPTVKEALKACEEGVPALVSIVTDWHYLPPGFHEFFNMVKKK